LQFDILGWVKIAALNLFNSFSYYPVVCFGFSKAHGWLRRGLCRYSEVVHERYNNLQLPERERERERERARYVIIVPLMVQWDCQMSSNNKLRDWGEGEQPTP